MAEQAAGSFCRQHGTLKHVMKIFMSPYAFNPDDGVYPKVAGCIVVYVLAYLYLPVLVQRAMSKGPQTVRRERLLGLFCWVLFAFIVTKWYHTTPYRYVTTSGWSDKLPGHTRQDLVNKITKNAVNKVTTKATKKFLGAPVNVPTSGWSDAQPQQPKSKLIFVMPVGGLADIFIICLLGAANAYLPMQFPDVVVNSLLGALLLIPVTLIEPTQDFIVHMTATPSSIAQLLGLFAVFGIYLGVAAPLFQAVAMNVVTWIISSAKYMWPNFNATSNLSVDSVRSLTENNKATKGG